MTIKKFEVHPIFPISIYMTNLERKFSKVELKTFKNFKKVKSAGNFSSEETYVLDKKPLLNLKKELLNTVKHYCDKVMCFSNEFEPFITQSWLNYTKENEYHHKHNHPNSFISGVLYIDVDESNDRIMFWKNTYECIKPQVKEFNILNSHSWWFNVKNYQLILFPSFLEHSVETKFSNNTRISLAFNTFLKGNIGYEKLLTELKL